MTKSTWKNIYNFDTTESNFDTTESNFDINDIVSSVSATSDFEINVRNNLNNLNNKKFNFNLNGGNIPLVYQMDNIQNGGSNDDVDSISTEELENKLRSIFTTSTVEVQKPLIGGNCDDDVPLIMATQYSDATSFSNTKNVVVEDDESSTSDDEEEESDVQSNNNNINLIQATQYSDATSFSNSH